MNSQERRDAILEGAERAAEVHERMLLNDVNSPVDVFRTIIEEKIGFLFRPLDKLLGVYLNTSIERGILVTTQRDLHVQRYTAAHELGHFLLNHQSSLDDEDLIGFVPRGRGHGNLQEVAADAFASEFLMPRWLVAGQVRRQQWTPEALKTPTVIYQLSLRLGVSYQAMCWGLAGHKVFSPNEARLLADIPPKTMKLANIDSSYLSNPWANVWLLTERDNGLTLVGTPDDVLQIELKEHASAGLTWNVETAMKQGFQILSDEQRTHNGIGSFGVRSIVLRGSGTGELSIEERRQWDHGSKPRTNFNIKYCLEGKETGLPRICRKALRQ